MEFNNTKVLFHIEMVMLPYKVGDGFLWGGGGSEQVVGHYISLFHSVLAVYRFHYVI